MSLRKSQWGAGSDVCEGVVGAVREPPALRPEASVARPGLRVRGSSLPIGGELRLLLSPQRGELSYPRPTAGFQGGA
jgi:hypothetical protein